MEEWFRDNVVLIVGFLCTGAVALWRISQLEKRSDKQSDTAREDRKAIDINLMRNPNLPATIGEQYTEN